MVFRKITAWRVYLCSRRSLLVPFCTTGFPGRGEEMVLIRTALKMNGGVHFQTADLLFHTW